MGVDDDGNLDLLLEGGNKVEGLLGAHDAGHILDADGLNAQRLDLLGQLDIAFKIVDGADGIADAAGGDGTALEGLIDGYFDIADIIEGIEDTDDINAIFHRFADEHTHHIIGIMLIAQQVLAAQQHLQRGLGAGLFDLAKALPRILVEVAQAAVKGGAAPALQRIVPGVIQFSQNRLELIERHTGGDERLVGITQHGLGELYGFFHGNPSCGFVFHLI